MIQVTIILILKDYPVACLTFVVINLIMSSLFFSKLGSNKNGLVQTVKFLFPWLILSAKLKMR